MNIISKCLTAFLLISCAPMTGTASPWTAEISLTDGLSDHRTMQSDTILSYESQSSVPTGPWLVSGLYTTASDGAASCKDATFINGSIFVGEGSEFQIEMDLAFERISNEWVAKEPAIFYHVYLPNGEVDHGYESYTGMTASLLSFSCTDRDMASIRLVIEGTPHLIDGVGSDTIRIAVEVIGTVPVKNGAY